MTQDISRPYPFCLAYPLEGEVEELGDVRDWQAEWKWDGIRSQLIRRNSQTFVWSRGEELVTDRFPELQKLGEMLPDGVVIDGEIMPWKSGRPMPFAELQRRIGRKVLGPKILADVPIALVAYDLLEYESADVREQPLEWRRERLTAVVRSVEATGRIVLSESVHAWRPGRSCGNCDASRVRRARRRFHAQALGVILSSRAKARGLVEVEDRALFRRRVGVAVRPTGQRQVSGLALFTDYTFGVWDNSELVPFAKAYSGLNDEEIRKVDAFVRRNTIEKFGPVRRVKPELVFELAFEGIQQSPRHRSGIAVRFPPHGALAIGQASAAEADTLETLRALLRARD